MSRSQKFTLFTWKELILIILTELLQLAGNMFPLDTALTTHTTKLKPNLVRYQNFPR